MKKVFKRVTLTKELHDAIMSDAEVDRKYLTMDVQEVTSATFIEDISFSADGKRYIVLNDDNTIIYALYDCIVAFNFHASKYAQPGEELINKFFSRLKSELGFTQKF